MGKYLTKILGGLIVLAGLFIGWRAAMIIGGWQHRNKVRLGITDAAPYLEMAVAGCGVAIGLWILLRRPGRR